MCSRRARLSTMDAWCLVLSPSEYYANLSRALDAQHSQMLLRADVNKGLCRQCHHGSKDTGYFLHRVPSAFRCLSVFLFGQAVLLQQRINFISSPKVVVDFSVLSPADRGKLNYTLISFTFASLPKINTYSSRCSASLNPLSC